MARSSFDPGSMPDIRTHDILFAMSRVLFLLVVLVLPLQSVWASAARYCQHETSTSSKQHFGHHEHQHQAAATDDTGKPGTDNKAVADFDCGICHSLSSVAAPVWLGAGPAPEPVAIPPPSTSMPIASALLRAPERPKWVRLA